MKHIFDKKVLCIAVVVYLSFYFLLANYSAVYYHYSLQPHKIKLPTLRPGDWLVIRAATKFFFVLHIKHHGNVSNAKIQSCMKNSSNILLSFWNH